MKRKLKLTTEAFDALAETERSLMPHLRLETARRLHRGGARVGAGRKRSGRSGRTIRLTDAVWDRLEAEASRRGLTVSAIIERRFTGPAHAGRRD